MSALINIETSVPSFYYETRPERDLQSRRDWTRQWWGMPKLHQELVIGLPVISELEETPSPKRDQVLALIAQLRILPTSRRSLRLWKCILPTDSCHWRRKATPTT
jgi:hypothetical protein